MEYQTILLDPYTDLPAGNREAALFRNFTGWGRKPCGQADKYASLAAFGLDAEDAGEVFHFYQARRRRRMFPFHRLSEEQFQRLYQTSLYLEFFSWTQCRKTVAALLNVTDPDEERRRSLQAELFGDEDMPF